MQKKKFLFFSGLMTVSADTILSLFATAPRSQYSANNGKLII